MLVRGYEDADSMVSGGNGHRESQHHHHQQVLQQSSPPSQPSSSSPQVVTSISAGSLADDDNGGDHPHHPTQPQGHLLCLLLGADRQALEHLQQHSLFSLDAGGDELDNEDEADQQTHLSPSSSPPLSSITPTITTTYHFVRFSTHEASQLQKSSITTTTPPFTSLQLVIHNGEHFLSSLLPAILHLLRSLSSHLVSLKLQLVYPPSRQLTAEYLAPIFSAINASCRRRLEHLTVELRCSLKSPSSMSIPLLGSAEADSCGGSALKELHFYARDEVLFLSSLLKIPSSSPLERIAFGCATSPTEMMRRLAGASDALTSRVVAIVTEEEAENGGDIFKHEDRLKLLEMRCFAFTFRSLQSLRLNLLSSQLDVHLLLDTILTLHQLHYLKLAINGDCILPPGGGGQMNSYGLPKTRKSSSPASAFSSPTAAPSPSSVRVLHLTLAMNSHCDLFDLDLPSRFPNLKVLLLEPLVRNTLSSSSSTSSSSSPSPSSDLTHHPHQPVYSSGIICDICGIKGKKREGEEDISPSIRSCASILLEHLKVHQRLQVVHFYCRPLHHKALRIPTAQIDQFIREQLT